MSVKKVPLACDVCKSINYHVHKSGEARLEVKKYCKHCNQSTLHKEQK